MMDVSDKAATILSYAKDFSNTLKRLATFVTNKASQEDMLKRGLINPSATGDEKSKIALEGSSVLDELADHARLVLQQSQTLTKTQTLGNTAPRPGFAPGTSSSSNDEE